MAEFYVSVSKDSMAKQIAVLVNKFNKWYKTHTAYSISRDDTDYFVEVVNDRVVGCVGLQKRFYNSSEIKHMCVEPEFRRKGIAKRLVNLAIANCNTEYVYMKIRDDNLPSLMLAKTLGFVPIKKHWSVDHFVVTVGRRKSYASIYGTQ